MSVPQVKSMEVTSEPEETGLETETEADTEEEEEESEIEHEQSENDEEEEHEEHEASVQPSVSQQRAAYSQFTLPVDFDLEEEEEEPELAEKSYRVKRNNELDFHNVKDLVNFLSKITLTWPEDLPDYNEAEFKADPKRINFPSSFYKCSPLEKAVLFYAENYRKQFLYKFHDRRPPLIAPKNECDCQKLFSTYIQPTAALGYLEFYNPETCVKFFKDYFSPQMLEPVPDPPTRIKSHVSVLKDRLANAFEHSVVVVSLLIGAGYNAYVVDGYASKEVTTMCGRNDYSEDMPDKLDYFSDKFAKNKRLRQKPKSTESRHDEIDLIEKDSEAVTAVSPNKYRLKPKKQFRSKYEIEMEEREEKRKQEEERAHKEKEYRDWVKSQRPPPADIMAGHRSHSWVLILPGIIPESGPHGEPAGPYFLEVFSGTKRPVSDPNFHGIEAAFNHKNYWINLQAPAKNCAEINFNLEDLECWSKMIYEPSLQKKAKEAESISSFQDEEHEEVVLPELHMTMPPSWTTELQISEEDYRKKFPGGKKTFEFNDAMVEVAAPFVNEDGLVKRIIKFSGKSRDPKNLLYIEERFDKRKDKMMKRVWHKKGRVVHEYFDKGRKDALIEHIHVSGRNKAHYPRHLYYSNVHPEGVYHRQVVHKGLVEHFENRHDFLYYRFTAFGGVLCRTLQPKDVKSKTKVFVEFVKGDASRDRPRRKIIGIIEKFYRNPQKKADHDIAEKHMLIEEGKFRILFHYGDESFTRRSLEFFKSLKGFKKETVDFKPEDCIEFRVDPFSQRTPLFEKYVILKQMQADQARSIEKAREAEDEVYQTVTNRVQEDWKNELELDYSSQAATEEEKARKKEMDSEEEMDLPGIDFASPYLELMVPKNLDEELALKQFILQNAKDRIMRQAEHIASCYQLESAKLKNLLKSPPNPKDELEAQSHGFATYYDHVLCKMHIMEQRLLRHRAKAPGDYTSLLIKVLQHPLLNKFTEEDKLQKQRQLIEALAPPPEEKKPEQKSCCVLDYLFKYTEKKKQAEEKKVTTDEEEEEQPALMIPTEERASVAHRRETVVNASVANNS